MAKLKESMIVAAQLEAEQKQKFLWDGTVTGLGLRVLAGGSKTFWYQYRPSGGRGAASRMVRIGPWPAVSLADARKAARRLAGAVARGDDPAADKQEERRSANATLRQLLAENGEYERHLKRRHIVNTAVVMSGLRRGLGRLMGRDIAAVTRQDFVTAITAIEDQGKPGAAADLRKFSRTFCDWAVQRGLASANVLAGLRKPTQTRAEKLAAKARKARALADAEVVAVWNACDGRGAFGNVVRLLLLSGAPRSEIGKLTREQILPDRLVLSPLSTKTGERHEVPLTELMRTVIAAQPAGLSKFAFPSEKTGRAYEGWNKSVHEANGRCRRDRDGHARLGRACSRAIHPASASAGMFSEMPTCRRRRESHRDS